MVPNTPHHCTAYCSAVDHCDLIYTSRPVTEAEVAQAYGVYRGLHVTRLTPAAEAAPLATIPDEWRDHLIGPPADNQHAYLVWWQ